MSSIKRYAPKIALFGNPIFRAIKVTNQNHRTINLFARGQVSFMTAKADTKSTHTTKEMVVAETPDGHTKSARNGDYIARQSDGSYLLIGRVKFERLYQETHIRIKDQ